MNITEEKFIEIACPQNKKVYFASDFHLGAPNKAESLDRERRLVSWLDQISADVAHLFLVGDIFDFWYEYKMVVPKGFVRLLGKLAELSDRGVGISFFTGNHDMWMKDYFVEELGVTIYRKAQLFSIRDQKFLIAHGDGLGPGDKGYKRLKKFLNSRITIGLFSIIPSAFSFGIANKFSKTSRGISQGDDFLGIEKEWLVQFAKEVLQKKKIQYFIFGHRHIPMDFLLEEGSKLINLGDWVNTDHHTYAEFDGKDVVLKTYEL